MWQQNKNYDRLGLVDDTVKILDVEVPNLLIPVHPGRQIAIIVEVAARNYRLKASGHHAAREMVESRVPQMMNLNEGSIITKGEIWHEVYRCGPGRYQHRRGPGQRGRVRFSRRCPLPPLVGRHYSEVMADMADVIPAAAGARGRRPR